MTSIFEKYPAKAHLQKVASFLPDSAEHASAILYMKGTPERPRATDADSVLPFFQHSNFFYVTGIVQPDLELIYHINTGKLAIFRPARSVREIAFNGHPPSPKEVMAQYEVDHVYEADYLLDHIRALSPSVIYTLPDELPPVARKGVIHDNASLIEALHAARVVKDDFEVQRIIEACRISTAAHHACGRHLRRATNERELDATFVYECTLRGGKNQAYEPIVAGGSNAATLHYIRNDEDFKGKELLLIDASCEFDHYTSDITRTYPISGKFSREAKTIYEIVLSTQKGCIDAVKPGITLRNLNDMAAKSIGKQLKGVGIIKEDAESDTERKLVSSFMPHGLGHHLGLDVHDVSPATTMFKQSSRNHRQIPADSPEFQALADLVLSPGMCLTVEPGVYFNDYLLDLLKEDAEQEAWIDWEVLEKYRSVGGVRIEDCVLITEDGHDILSTAVKEVKDVEALVQGWM